VFARDNYTCTWCGEPGGHLDPHHVIRRSQGGKDEVDNLKAVHRRCHRYLHEHPAEAKARGFLS
jgi:RNA-directed DNA polymerase